MEDRTKRAIPTGLLCLVLIASWGCATSPEEEPVERITPEEAADSIGYRTSTASPDGLGCLEGDCENGRGVYAYSKDVIYRGEFNKGLPNGSGSMEYANGDSYTGSFVDGKRSGQGKYLFANGDYYDGEFAEGKRSGKGVYSFASGGVFEGEFLDDGVGGSGLFHVENEKSLNCELKNYSIFCDVEGHETLIRKMHEDSGSEAGFPQRSFFEGNR